MQKQTNVASKLPKEWKVSSLIETFRREKPKLKRRYQVKSFGIFGSYLHNKQRRGSDLDVLVEFLEPPSLFKFLELESRLTELTGVQIDLVMKDTLKPVIGRHILAEVVRV